MFLDRADVRGEARVVLAEQVLDAFVLEQVPDVLAQAGGLLRLLTEQAPQHVLVRVRPVRRLVARQANHDRGLLSVAQGPVVKVIGGEVDDLAAAAVDRMPGVPAADLYGYGFGHDGVHDLLRGGA